jgi:hypothetical protein
MYKFDEQALRKGISMGLGSQGIWTPELENVMFDEITNEALHKTDVVGRSEQLPCPICSSDDVDAEFNHYNFCRDCNHDWVK